MIIGVSSYPYDHVKEKIEQAGFTDGYYEAPLTNSNIKSIMK